MADEVCDNGGSGGSSPNKVVVDGQQPPPTVVEVVEDKNKSPRHPRWTRQETLTLIEGKKVAENRGRRGRRSSSSVFGSDQIEPKWDSVSSYCKQHAVNRGPVQCRKRWSNMVGDFKKIKAWESQLKHESESYWVMRNDLRKENKLPGFFDREVFDVLDGKAFTTAAYQLAVVTVSADTQDELMAVVAGEEEDEEEGEAEVVFDSGRRDDGLFPESEKVEEEADGEGDGDRTPESPNPMPISGTLNDHQTNSVPWKKHCTSQEGCKRRKVSTNEHHNRNFDTQLIEVLEKNANSLNAHLEAESTNSQLERDQRKEYNNNMVSALNRISDALMKIADKL
ncbi:hypothetical protein LXL04_030843 [Taraxacum kok-saghyz]